MGTKRLLFTKNVTYNGEVYGDNGEPYGVGVFIFADSGLSFEAKCNWYEGSMVDFNTIKVVNPPKEHRFLFQILDVDDGVGGYTNRFFNEFLAYYTPKVGKTNYRNMELLFDRSDEQGIQSYFEVLEINNEGIKFKLSERFSDNKTKPIQFIKYGECLRFGWEFTHTHLWEHDEEFETTEVHYIDIYLF